MTKTALLVAAAAAVLSLCGQAADAATVKYYSRQNLTALAPVYAYTATYGAYGSCSGTQTASIATCTRNDGKTVANSFCSPQTKTQTCTPIACSGWQSYYQAVNGTLVQLETGDVSSSSQAQTLCQNYANSHAGTRGVCQWRSNSGDAWYGVASTKGYVMNSGLNAAVCQ